MLVGTTMLLGVIWPLMGARHRARLDLLCRHDRGALGRLRGAGRDPRQCVGHPHGRRAGRRHLVQCRGQGASAPRTREEERLDDVVGKWRQRTRAHLAARHAQRRRQGARWSCCAPRFSASACCSGSRGVAKAGDIALRAHLVLRAAGLSARHRPAHPQPAARRSTTWRSWCDMQCQPLGIEDRPDAQASRDRGRPHRVRPRRLPLRQRTPTPLYRDFSVTIRGGRARRARRLFGLGQDRPSSS